MFYDKDIDEMGQRGNDIGPEDAHFCDMYDGAIPKGIFDGPKKCRYYMDKMDGPAMAADQSKPT
jgi:hypothetical protein